MTTQINSTIDRERLEVTMIRAFDAPRELVFRVWTDADLIPKWWGPRNLTTTVDKLDLRPGGSWRFIHHDADGNEYAFHGDYLEVVAPERVVGTFEWEGLPGHVITETATFEEREGKTIVTTTSRFDSIEDLEGMLQTGMEHGANESFERITELLQELQAA